MIDVCMLLPFSGLSEKCVMRTRIVIICTTDGVIIVLMTYSAWQSLAVGSNHFYVIDFCVNMFPLGLWL